MNILSPTCGFTADATGGGARYEYDLTTGLAQAGHIVTTVQFPGRGFGHWPWAWATMGPILARELIGGHYDLLRCHSAPYLGPACLLARQFAGVRIPLVTHVHHWEPICAPIERWVISQSDLVVADSEFVARQLIREFDRVGKMDRLPRIHIAGCGVKEPGGDKPLFKVVGEHLVVTVGPVIERKRPLEMVRMWADVVDHSPGARLVWLGDGPLRAKAKAEAERLNICDSVSFLGYVPEGVKNTYLRSADLFVFMSRLEGCPLAVLEAMAAGLPIVAPWAGPLTDLLGRGQAVDESIMPERIVRFLTDHDEARHAADRNYRVWLEQYTNKAWLGSVQTAYRGVL